MPPVMSALLAFVVALFRSRAALCLENLALRHQVAIYKQTVPRPRLHPTDRLVWVWLSRLWSGWQRVRYMGIHEVVTAPHSPWQNPYVERLIGSIRRECLDQVIVLHERHLQRLLTGYFAYYQRWRTHLSLAMDCPQSRPIQPLACGPVIAVPAAGGLHYHYERVAA